MRILIVHNYYGRENPSGENVVVDTEVDLLSRRGHDVHVFERDTDSIREKGPLGAVAAAALVPWNQAAAAQLRSSAQYLRPDVIHFHNVFPLVSPSAMVSVRGLAPRVLTLHNYRFACAAGVLLRDGEVCTDCLDSGSPIHGLKHACYRGSRLASLPLVAGIALHDRLGTWRDLEGYVCLSEFQRDMVSRAGFPAERLHVKPNFLEGHPAHPEWSTRQDRVLFVGRLSEEKGPRVAVEAWCGEHSPEVPLHVIGTGPELEGMRRRASEVDADVAFLGLLTPAEVLEQLASAKLVVLPSLCYEGFPMVLREAFAMGTPALGSDLGPLPEILSALGPDQTFRAGDSRMLADKIRKAFENPEDLERIGMRARRLFETRYNEDAAYEALMAVYARASENWRSRFAT